VFHKNEEARHVQELTQANKSLELMRLKADTLEAHLKIEVDLKVESMAQNEVLNALVSELRDTNLKQADNVKELALQVAEQEVKSGNSDSQLFNLSKRCAISDEKVLQLQTALANAQSSLTDKQDSEAEAAILAKDAVVCKLQIDLRDTRIAKEEIEIALGRLVAQGEIAASDWDKEKKVLVEELAKAMQKVDKLPTVQGQLTEATNARDKAEVQLAVATGKLRILEDLQMDAETANRRGAQYRDQITTQEREISRRATETEQLNNANKELSAQCTDLRSKVAQLESVGEGRRQEREETDWKLAEKDALIEKMRLEIEQLLTDTELRESEIKGVRYQCADLQSKLIKEREEVAREKSIAERDRELAVASKSEVCRLQLEKGDLSEELEATKVQIRALMIPRRPSSFSPPELEQYSTQIFTFIRMDKTEETEELLATGLPVDITDSLGFTPLMMAYQRGLRKIVKVCLRRGASIDMKNHAGDTALHCCGPEHRDLAAYLISKGADESIVNKEGRKWLS